MEVVPWGTMVHEVPSFTWSMVGMLCASFFVIGFSTAWWNCRRGSQKLQEDEAEEESQPEVESEGPCVWLAGSPVTHKTVYHTDRGCLYLNKKNSRAPRQILLCTECAQDFKYITHR